MATNRIATSAAGRPTGGLEGFFRLREHGTDVRTEVLAGLTTFFVMAYIIAVNPAVLAAAGLDPRAVATSTCLVAGLLSIAMGLYTNRAFAIAPGLGLNAIVAYNLVGTMGLTPAEAMGVVVVEGVLITVLVLLGVRKYVMDVVPFALSRAIAVGIGFFNSVHWAAQLGGDHLHTGADRNRRRIAHPNPFEHLADFRGHDRIGGDDRSPGQRFSRRHPGRHPRRHGHRLLCTG